MRPLGSARFRPDRSEQLQLFCRVARWLKMFGCQLGVLTIETELLAGNLEASADHPGDRPAAGHPLPPTRVVVLAPAGLANDLEHMLVTVRKIRDQPFAEQVPHF